MNYTLPSFGRQALKLQKYGTFQNSPGQTAGCLED